MSPPQLTRNTPVFNIFQPLMECLFKTFWIEIDTLFRYFLIF